MVKVEDLINKLNEEQKDPVLNTEGPVLVIAGAGSGKTRVLTTRIAHLVINKNVSPSKILAITFTNKAADEMKTRLCKIIGDIGDMWVSTIHSMCVRILRSQADKIGYDRNFTIYDETDKDRLLKFVLERLNFDADKLLKGVKSAISIAKNDCITPEEFSSCYSELRNAEEYADIYKEYQRELEKSNCFDFDDLLFKTYELFKTHPEVADYYSDKFEYVHIDEFQDTNKVQFVIAQRLALSHGNIFVVGDDDQSIYGWRGAKIENILSFDKTYNNAKVYKLEQNYRSTKKILALANCIIANNHGRRPKELWTNNDEGAKIETYIGSDENSEASFTAFQIKGLLDRGYKYSDFAVFMRVNALSRAYEQEFIKYGIPYKVYGGFKFFERKEIKDLLAYLKVVNNHYDVESFLRCIASPKRGIGDKTLRELREFCVSVGLSMFDGIDRLDETSIGSAGKTKLINFKTLLQNFIDYSKNNTVEKLMEYVIEKTGFIEQFEEKTEENTSRIYNINELKNTAALFLNDNPGSTLSDYLNSVTLSTDTDDINNDNTVTVATIHAVKGLEYKCVFVSGLDENILPIQRSLDLPDELEEERRLMYVAVTRAKERLYLTRASSRYMYGRREYMTQSRFLKEGQPVLNPNAFKERSAYSLYNEEQYNKFNFENRREAKEGYGDYPDLSCYEGSSSTVYNSSYAKTFLKNNTTKVSENISYNNYKTGIKVNHAKFGEGTVIEVKGEGENIIVSVAFKGVGIKQLSAKYAPMEIK